jgi:predicted ABC-type sugar transport system permease subunit
VSIAVMEIIDNTAMLAIPGAMDAGLTSGLFWGSLVAALALAFIVTTPVNRWLISRGKGHAVVHELHR